MLPSPLDMLDDIVVNEFNEKAALDFRNRVMKIAKLDPQRPIVVYIDSYGGSVYALGSMIAVMEEAPNAFITVAVGKAMSCGAMLLAAGDMRFADKHSEILIHEISAGAIGDVNDIKNDTENIVKLNEKWMNFIAEKCGIEGGFQAIKELIRMKDGRNLYFNPQQAKEFGLIDHVGSPHITPVLMYQVSNSNKEDPIEPKSAPEEQGSSALVDMLKQMAENGDVKMVKLSDMDPELQEKVKDAKKKTKKTTKKKAPAKKKVTKKKTTKKK